MTENLPENPLSLFQNWMSDAQKSEINDPEAMALATCDRNGKPSVRIVLLKEANEKGFKFHTNCESDKGRDLDVNPQAALCFHWKTLRKQVRIEGCVERVSEEEADQYFANRPYARQVGAWASMQSKPLNSREALEQKIKEIEAQYPEGSIVPRPTYWVGYRVIPEKIEFWWDNPDRLHDRFVYKREHDHTWLLQRLYP